MSKKRQLPTDLLQLSYSDALRQLDDHISQYERLDAGVIAAVEHIETHSRPAHSDTTPAIMSLGGALAATLQQHSTAKTHLDAGAEAKREFNRACPPSSQASLASLQVLLDNASTLKGVLSELRTLESWVGSDAPHPASDVSRLARAASLASRVPKLAKCAEAHANAKKRAVSRLKQELTTALSQLPSLSGSPVSPTMRDPVLSICTGLESMGAASDMVSSVRSYLEGPTHLPTEGLSRLCTLYSYLGPKRMTAVLEAGQPGGHRLKGLVSSLTQGLSAGDSAYSWEAVTRHLAPVYAQLVQGSVPQEVQEVLRKGVRSSILAQAEASTVHAVTCKSPLPKMPSAGPPPSVVDGLAHATGAFSSALRPVLLCCTEEGVGLRGQPPAPLSLDVQQATQAAVASLTSDYGNRVIKGLSGVTSARLTDVAVSGRGLVTKGKADAAPLPTMRQALQGVHDSVDWEGVFGERTPFSPPSEYLTALPLPPLPVPASGSPHAFSVMSPGSAASLVKACMGLARQLAKAPPSAPISAVQVFVAALQRAAEELLFLSLLHPVSSPLAAYGHKVRALLSAPTPLVPPEASVDIASAGNALLLVPAAAESALSQSEVSGHSVSGSGGVMSVSAWAQDIASNAATRVCGLLQLGVSRASRGGAMQARADAVYLRAVCDAVKADKASSMLGSLVQVCDKRCRALGFTAEL
ncbi:hypothetical protein KIPB_005003 [Kipferlia bialata]|uniref:Uncharacterized protein n=1 Tax=Kipferlia bialata TaxID=797122 RepID=A0A9K3CWV6_9EUKA|nr:hypothetical protein KIPB_003848 [Kipferlia bialata]GIQ83650.1 hypothetical protein KIPB_005003 [Kipferlia bialata]|eukprot:g3848.t1